MKKDAEYYLKKFNELRDSNIEIVNNKTKEIFKFSKDEEFRQCYANTSERKTFPKYWFISNKGNLLSVKSNKIQWINKIPRKDSNKFSYKYRMYTDNGDFKVKNIEAHNLIGLVFGVSRFGLATTLLNEKGVEAFGVRNKHVLCVQGHHNNGDDTDNSPENLNFVTTEIHTLLHDKLPNVNSENEKKYNFMKDLGQIICKENPDEFTIILTGQKYLCDGAKYIDDKSRNIKSSKGLMFSNSAYEELNAMVKMFN